MSHHETTSRLREQLWRSRVAPSLEMRRTCTATARSTWLMQTRGPASRIVLGCEQCLLQVFRHVELFGTGPALEHVTRF